jgi:hypothetical protein
VNRLTAGTIVRARANQKSRGYRSQLPALHSACLNGGQFLRPPLDRFLAVITTLGLSSLRRLRRVGAMLILPAFERTTAAKSRY